MIPISILGIANIGMITDWLVCVGWRTTKSGNSFDKAAERWPFFLVCFVSLLKRSDVGTDHLSVHYVDFNKRLDGKSGFIN